MIIARVYGGLGNQMFQYALGRRLALDRGVSLWLDTSWYRDPLPPGVEARTFALNRFNTAYRELPRWIERHLPRNAPGGDRPARNRWARLCPTLFAERGMAFDADVLRAPAHALIDGYWQSEKYFRETASEIRRDFALRRPLSNRAREFHVEIAKGQSVSLHVRRGDYVTNPASAAFHGTCSAEWYRDAMEMMLDQVGPATFFVFSDDQPWARDNLPRLGPLRFVDAGAERPEEDLHLMASCDHHIIANSSFSWWGAWLNPRSESRVIAPRRWFLVEADLSDRIPARWHML